MRAICPGSFDPVTKLTLKSSWRGSKYLATPLVTYKCLNAS